MPVQWLYCFGHYNRSCLLTYLLTQVVVDAASSILKPTLNLTTTTLSTTIRPYHHIYHVPQSFTPDLKLISFANPFPIVFLFLPDCFHISWTCTELRSGHKLFVCFFLISCARLSWSHWWSHVQLIIHVKLLYRIVSYRQCTAAVSNVFVHR